MSFYVIMRTSRTRMHDTVPKAELLYRERRELAGGGIMQATIWRVPTPVPPSQHPLKYSLVYIVTGERVIGYDNERGKATIGTTARARSRIPSPRRSNWFPTSWPTSGPQEATYEQRPTDPCWRHRRGLRRPLRGRVATGRARRSRERTALVV